MAIKKTTKKKAIKKIARTKKAPTKKITRKKTAVKKKAVRQGKKRLTRAAPEQCFWVNAGPVLRDLRELEEALRVMSNEQFAYHTAEGNHFAQWVESVLLDAVCAQALMRAKTRKGAVTIVMRYIKTYK